MTTERKNILIVDDIELNRAILFELFHDQFNVLEAENGKVAIEMIDRYAGSIAAILLDIIMPVMDGYAVLHHMADNGALDRIPVIMITVESDNETVLQVYKMGAADIINKPFHPEIVKHRVHNIIDLYSYKAQVDSLMAKQGKQLAPDATQSSQNAEYSMNREALKYSALTELSEDIIFDYDNRNDTMHFSDKFNMMFSENSTIQNFRHFLLTTDLIRDDQKDLIFREALLLSSEKSRNKVSVMLKTRSEKYEWFDIMLNAIFEDGDGIAKEKVGYVGRMKNVHTARTEANHVSKSKKSDTLTGLYSASETKNAIEQYMKENPDGSAALFFLDIDNFRSINDTMGQQFGDKVLIHVAKVLKKILRARDIIGRSEGDQFIIFLPDFNVTNYLENKAKEISDAFQKEFFAFSIPGKEITVSLGAAKFPLDSTDIRGLMEKTDKCLAMAKHTDQLKYVIYENSFEERELPTAFSILKPDSDEFCF